MSVINKMLRDLDQRRATTLDPVLRAGVSPSPVPPAAASAHAASGSVVSWVLAALAALAVLLVLAGGWWMARGMVPPLAVPVALFGVVAAPAETPAPGADRPVAQTADVPAFAATGSTPAIAPAPAPDSSSPTAKRVAVPPLPLPLVPSALQLASTPFVTLPQAAPVRQPLPEPSVVSPVGAAPEPVVSAQRQQSATRDVLAQAQGLYTGGSADAAIQLLQDALQTAERASPPASAITQLQLVRELSRMELAQGRASAVLDLLGRMEPLMTGQSDLWALRANAAQRLGRHSDAVQFYAVALQTRPSEQRWLLGSAVSLAALGQLAAAAELTDKARSMAPVSKEVLSYLRQQGVVVPERP